MFIKVRVKTGARNESIEEIAPQRFEVAVREKPEGNRANNRVVALVAARFGVPARAVRIASGLHRRSKSLSIDLK